MIKFRNLLAAAVLLSASATAYAQDTTEDGLDYKPYPHMFVGVQGGVQNTFNKEFNNWKTFTPTASLSFGSWFIPQVGARLHFNGLWNKSGVDYLDDTEDGHYKYNYLTSSADLLLNLCTIFGKKDYYPVNLYYVMGLGANYAWEGRGRAEDAAATYLANMKYADNDNRWAFNGRVGLGLDIPVCKNLSVNVEGDLNHIVPGKSTKFNTDLLQLTVQAGLAYKFGFKKKPAPEEVWETRIDTIWYDDIAYTPRVEDGSITNGFLTLFGRPARDKGLQDERGSDVTAKQRLYLFNSATIHRQMGQIAGPPGKLPDGTPNPIYQLPFPKRVDDIYWRMLAREPTPQERQLILGIWQKRGGGKKRNVRPFDLLRDVAWCLINTKEFIFRI